MTHFEPTEALHLMDLAEDHLSMSIYYDNEAYNERQKAKRTDRRNRKRT